MTEGGDILDIRVQTEDFDIAAEVHRVTTGRRDLGAVVTFSGICRDEDGRLAALELEHYPGMAEEEIGRIAAETSRRWPISALTVVHRVGRIEPGDNIVLVLTASQHREAAFAAADYMMDFLKTRAPFWKKECTIDGGEGKWVDASVRDDEAASRWSR